MTILYIISSGGVGSGGGSSVAIHKLLSCMVDKPNVKIYAVVSGEGDFTEWMRKSDITPFIVPNLKNAIYPREKNVFKYIKRLFGILWHDSLAVFRIAQIIKQVKPEIIHTNNAVMGYGYFAARLTGTKHLWHLREYIDLDHQYKIIPCMKTYKRWLRHSFTVSITEDVASHHHCINPNKDFVVYDGVMHRDETRFEEVKEDYFLFVGSIIETKGVSELIRSFCQYAKRNQQHRLLLAGRGCEDYIRKLEKYAKEQGVGDRIEFLGFRNDRYDLMAKAQALIVPSPFEAFGFITVEAMMNGCLVIGHNTAGTKMIMDKAAGCELPYNTPDDLVGRLEDVATNGASYYRDRVLRAQKVANDIFTIEQACEKTYQVYKKILNLKITNKNG